MKYQSLTAAALAAITFALVVPPRAQAAQEAKIDFPQASPAASVKDRFGLTTVEIEYSRPSVKGRKIFGGLVPFGEVWRTGANAATKITFSANVKFGGVDVPAGSYALFTRPGPEEWTVMLSDAQGQWGAYAYDPKDDVASVKVRPSALTEPVETMSLGLTDLRSDSAMLTIAWENTRVSVRLEMDIVSVVVPQIKAAMAGSGKKPYFPAAMFYYDHDLDLKQALAWMDEALKEQPEAVWIVYRKGLILAKTGDKAGATAAAKQAMQLAEKAGGSLGAEYKRLSESLLASLK
jgi:hypothetical protein